jgi:hypothetical protein
MSQLFNGNLIGEHPGFISCSGVPGGTKADVYGFNADIPGLYIFRKGVK